MLASDRYRFEPIRDPNDLFPSREPRSSRRPANEAPARTLRPPLPVRGGPRPQDLQAEAEQFRQQGRYREAEPLLTRALEVLRQRPDAAQAEIGVALDRLGWIHQAMGRYQQAEPLYRQAIAALEAASGPEHADTLRSLNNLARLHIDQERYAEADALAARVLAIREAKLGADHPDLAESLDTLGALHLQQRRLAEADPALKRALDIREKALGPEHPDLAASIARMAALRHRQERIGEAEPFARRALAMREKILGPEHPETATSVERIAGLHVHKKQYGEAEALSLRTLAIREKMLGEEHPTTVALIDRMGSLYLVRRNFDAAEAHFKRALEIRERTLGPEHPDVGETLERIGMLRATVGSQEDAEPFHRRALAIKEKAFGPDDPRLAPTLVSLARNIENPGESEALIRRALGIQQKALGAAHRETVDTFTSLLRLYRRQERLAEARELAERLLADVDAQGGEDGPALVMILDALAELYAPNIVVPGPKSRVADAVLLLARALEIRERVIGPDHAEIIERLQKLARLSVAVQKPEDAEQYLKRALAIAERTTAPEAGTTAFIVGDLATFYKDHKRVAEAEQFYLRYISISEAILLKNSRNFNVSSKLRELAELYKAQNRLAEMEEIYKRFLAPHDSQTDGDVIARTAFITMLADFYDDQHRYAEAEALYLRDVAIREKAFQAGSKFVLPEQSLSGLHEIYKKTQRQSEGEDLYKRMLALTEQAYGPDSPQVLSVLFKLSSVYLWMGEKRDAEYEALLKRMLAHMEKDKGPDHPDLASRLESLAGFYSNTDRDGEAEPLLKRAVAILENRPGQGSKSLESMLRKLAEFYINLDRHAEAESLLRRGLAVTEKARGAEHRELIRPLLLLADVQAKQGNPAQAAESLKRAVAIEEKVMQLEGSNFFPNYTALEAADRFYQAHEQHAEREALLKNRLAVEEKLIRSGAIDTLSAAFRLGMFYRDREREGEREAMLKHELALLEDARGPEHEATLRGIDVLAAYYDRQGRDAEAAALFERLVQITEKIHGPEHKKTLDALLSLARPYSDQGRHGDAEGLYKRVLAAYENTARPEASWFRNYTYALGGLVRLHKGMGRTGDIEQLFQGATAIIEAKALAPAGQNVNETFAKAVEFYQEHRRYSEALSLAQRWLAMKEAEAIEAALRAPLEAVGTLHVRLVRYAEAEPYLKRTLAIAEKVEGPESQETVDAMLSLAELYRIQGRYAEADPLNERALAIDEAVEARFRARSRNNSRSSGNPKGRVAASLRSLASLRRSQGRYSEAEEALKRSHDLYNHQWGFAFQPTLHDLGSLFLDLGRFAESEPLLKLALKISQERSDGETPGVAAGLHKLAEFYMAGGRHAEAEPLIHRALAMSEKVNGPSHPSTLVDLFTLSRLRRAQDRPSEAEPLLKRVEAGYLQIYGPDHPATLRVRQELFAVQLKLERRSDAEALLPQIQASVAKIYAPEQPATAENDFLLAQLEEMRGNWGEAWRLRRNAADILIRHTRKQNEAVLGSPAAQGGIGLQNYAASLTGLVESAAKLSQLEPERVAELGADSFEIVQWARSSEAASALAQTSARFAKGDDKLAELVRQRQDLVGRFKAVDGDLVTSITESAEAGEDWKQRRDRREQIWSERRRIDAAIQDIDAALKVQFPDYAALANPEPLSVAQTQALLKPDQALYQVAFTEEAAYAWVVTKQTMRWQTLPVKGRTVDELVAALRCGLDSAAWETGAGTPQAGQPEGQECRQLVGPSAGGALPFDLVRAHELYKILFSPFEDLIRDKHLLVVPPGLLASLPLQVLVTEAPDPALRGDERYEQAAWLARRQAITVLPSVPSLKALRSSTRRQAEHPYSGFGNPLLTGLDGEDRSAWERTDCPVATSSLHRVRDTLYGGMLAMANLGPRGGVQSYYRGGLGDVAMIRRQQPLPETADELCSVAQALGGRTDDVYLGARASETTLKALSRQGRLSGSRVVHFATHGLIGGETEVLTRSRLEPALIMTPPDKPTEEDDGLLTASEAAQLDLNADLVILSACNTAAGDGRAGQSLSGLARAFLYAGSRALLASHWYVNSEGAVELVTGMFAEIAETPGIGRAEALRRTMAARIDAGGPRAHPSYWAPFVIVGEGG